MANREQPAALADAVVSLADAVQFLPGSGFGICQSVVLGTIDLRLPEDLSLAEIEKVMEDVISAQSQYEEVGDDMEMRLMARIYAWQSTIQILAKIPVFGLCRLWNHGELPERRGARRFGFALPSHEQSASTATLEFVIEVINAVIRDLGTPESISHVLRERYESLTQLLQSYALAGTNMLHFIEAAHLLGIERRHVLNQLWAFGLGHKRSYFNSSMTSATSALGMAISKDKIMCGQLLASMGLPVANHALAHSVDDAVKIAEQIGYPVVVKPVDADQGLGVTAGIEDENDLRQAFATAAEVGKRVMVEKHHDGSDYRVTVLHGKAIKVMDRRPGGVTGDGSHTIAELVEARNVRDAARRAKFRKKRRHPLLIDEEAMFLLSSEGLTPLSVLPLGQFLPLRRRANISAGGTYEILALDEVHPDNLQLGESAASALGLDIAGIDIISLDPRASWRETGGIICEVNGQPQIGYLDSEMLFARILEEVLTDHGQIPVHLTLLQEGLNPPATLPDMAQQDKCNAAVFGTLGWIEGGGMLGPYTNVFRAAKGVLLDQRVKSAVVAMTESELLQFGLPVARFASIRLLGSSSWEPTSLAQQLIADHTNCILRLQLSPVEKNS